MVNDGPGIFWHMRTELREVCIFLHTKSYVIMVFYFGCALKWISCRSATTRHNLYFRCLPWWENSSSAVLTKLQDTSCVTSTSGHSNTFNSPWFGLRVIVSWYMLVCKHVAHRVLLVKTHLIVHTVLHNCWQYDAMSYFQVSPLHFFCFPSCFGMTYYIINLNTLSILFVKWFPPTNQSVNQSITLRHPDTSKFHPFPRWKMAPGWDPSRLSTIQGGKTQNLGPKRTKWCFG